MRRGGRVRRLLAYARHHRRGWTGLVVLTLVSSGVGLLAPWPLKVVVDDVLGKGDEGLLPWVVGAGLLIFFAASACDAALSYLWIRVGQSMVYDLSRDLFARIQRRSLRQHLREGVGDPLARVTDDAWAVHTVADELVFTPGHALVTASVIGVVLAQLDATLALVSFAVAPLMVVASTLLGRRLREAGRELRTAEVDIGSHIQQTLSGIPVVQAFTQEDRHGREFRRLAGAAIRARVRSIFLVGLNDFASGLVTAIGTAVVLYFGAHAVIDGRLSIGDLLVFVAYLAMLQDELRGLTGIYASLQSARASIDRVGEVLEAEPDVRERPGAPDLPPLAGHVRLEAVTVAYEPGRPVLSGVTLEARPGETIGLVGATGAGKTTLVSLLPRFLDPDEGRVTLDGHDVREVSLSSVRSQVALVLQESFLFPTTVGANIAYGRPGASREQIERAARAAAAHEFIERLPAGYETPVGERGATLSGGERQRIAIARALLRDAPILVLDEPTSALDAETERELLVALRALMAGRTTFLIAHRLSSVREADRICVLAGGRLVEQGSHEELLEQGGAYARMVEAQAGRRVEVPA